VAVQVRLSAPPPPPPPLRVQKATTIIITGRQAFSGSPIPFVLPFFRLPCLLGFS